MTHTVRVTDTGRVASARAPCGNFRNPYCRLAHENRHWSVFALEFFLSLEPDLAPNVRPAHKFMHDLYLHEFVNLLIYGAK